MIDDGDGDDAMTDDCWRVMMRVRLDRSIDSDRSNASNASTGLDSDSTGRDRSRVGTPSVHRPRRAFRGVVKDE